MKNKVKVFKMIPALLDANGIPIIGKDGFVPDKSKTLTYHFMSMPKFDEPKK